MAKAVWDPAVLISDRLKLRRKSVHAVINLLEDGATIPFIARYRKEQTDDMGTDNLRAVATSLEELRSVESKMQNVYESIQKMGRMTKDLETSLCLSTSILEVDAVYAPFKPGHKGSYAERARALGLGDLANSLLEGKQVNFTSVVDPSTKGLETIDDVEKGIKHIIADIISKDKAMMDMARSICDMSNIMLESSRVNAKAVQKKKLDKKIKLEPVSGKDNNSSQKFEQYFDFKIPVKLAKPHQILALNRGESLKILTLKLVIPEYAKTQFMNRSLERLYTKVFNPGSRTLIRVAVLDSYDRLIEPMLVRHLRSDLTKMAEKNSISVFTSNLKGLLLTPPIKQKTILGIDPGFKNGCKFAAISSTGLVMATGVAYLHDYRSNKMEEKLKLSTVVRTCGCDTITIGNGVACRETEQVISDMIQSGLFKPLSVAYCIVDECGASIYSVSDVAQGEMPDLDPTLRGAVSIARRLQDPLAEFVKIEPKHLGVGMYQHDLNKTKLQTALNSVVEECVSFVGVDLNTCSECLLRRVAGLNATKAKNILDWKSKHGQFINRQQLLGIKGLGKKGFEQCAGFIRIVKAPEVTHCNESKAVKQEIVEPDVTAVTKGRKRKIETASSANKGKKAKTEHSLEWNPLDATAVHPETYHLANLLASHLGVELCDIGRSDFISKVKRAADCASLKSFSEKNSAGFATVKFISEALQQPLCYDFRESFQKPVFKKEIMSLSDLKLGSVATGRVTNVTNFGAFVDIGVGLNGLIHVSRMGRHGKLGVGDHVEVKVESMDLNRKRIGLMLTDCQAR